MVTRFTLLKELSAIVPDDVLVLTSIGNNSGHWGQLKEREANLFHLTMGMCSSTALGLSLALPNRKIVDIDSDGNLTLNLGVLGTIANEAPKNLTIVLMDNQNYLGSNKDAPGMPTATAGKMNLEAVAKGSSTAVHD
jgi:sulfopyruvate decarboxylase subunit beta